MGIPMLVDVDVEDVFVRCEEALVAGGKVDLAKLGFWKAVETVKKSPVLVERFADRIAYIDRTAFLRWALIAVPVVTGTVIAVVVTLVGLTLIALAYGSDPPLNGILLIVGFGIVLVTTHGLAHLVVGRAQGMRFTHWFVGTLSRPNPGVKVDYARYLRVPPSKRAWMHASGALVSKIVPFAMLGAAFAMNAPAWAVVVLIAVGVVSIVTDVIWSTKKSDWKKFKREMGLAR